MRIARDHLEEARKITGNQHLTARYVTQGCRFRFGFMTDETDFSVRVFKDGAAGYAVEKEDGISWYVVTLKRGATLCTWQDPFGLHHHRLFSVTHLINVTRVRTQFATDEQRWKLMADIGIPLGLLRQVIKGCGVKNVPEAIELARLGSKKPEWAKSLVEQALHHNFTAVRRLLAATRFAQCDDNELFQIIYGVKNYIDATTK